MAPSASCFLDFGNVKRLDRAHMDIVVGFLDHTATQDTQGIYQWARRHNWITDRSQITPAQLLGWWTEGYPYLLPDQQPVTITGPYAATVLHNRTAPGGPQSRVPRQLDIPADYLLAGRMDVAMLAILGGLTPTANWHAIRRELHHHTPPTTDLGHQDAQFRQSRS